jgi:hypothetical protein
VKAWALENKANPRIDIKALAGRVPIEEVLRAFTEASAYINQPEPQPDGGPTRKSQPYGSANGAEVWLRDPDSNLCGRADYISDANILDFKSGDEKDHHTEQILFYGALYLAAIGNLPRALRLFYTKSATLVDVPVPNQQSLHESLLEMRRRATSAEDLIIKADLKAIPELPKCAMCHVRGLCDRYWQSLSPTPTREHAAQPSFIDYTPSPAVTVEPAAQGCYLRDTLYGSTSSLYVPQEVVLRAGQNIRRIRVLSLRANASASGINLAFTQSTEIFIPQQ